MKKHRIYWDPDPKRPDVLRIELEHAANWHDFSQMIEDAAEMVQAHDGSYDVIVQPHGLIPPGDAVPHLRHGHKLLIENPNMRVLVIVVPTLAMVLVNSLQRIMELLNVNIPQTHFVNSLDQAISFIDQRRQDHTISTVPSESHEDPSVAANATPDETSDEKDEDDTETLD